MTQADSVHSTPPINTSAQAADASSTLPDQAVVACVTRSYMALSFPAPEGGIVMVTQVLELLP